MSIRSGKLWRRNNPEKRNKQRKSYYRRMAENRPRKRMGWTVAEIERITNNNRPSDRALATELGRSVEAIQVKRSKLKN